MSSSQQSASDTEYLDVQNRPGPHSEVCERLQSPALDEKVIQGRWKPQAVPAVEEHLFKTQGEGEEVHEKPLPKMEPTTRNLIFSIPQDTDSKYGMQNGHQMVLQGEVRYEVQGDEYLDVGHHSQQAGNGWRTKNPPEDGSRWEAKAINGRKDLWTPSPDRECKLEVVKSGSLYDIRAYKGDKKPSRLYNEEDAELQYKLPPEDVSPREAQELEDERQEVIRSQVVRKSTTIAERWSSMDELEAINNTASPSRNAAENSRSYSTGFAVCFDNPSPNWMNTPVDPENIDTEQINFAAARQQFLALEKSSPNLLLGSRRQVSSPRSQAMRNVYEMQRQSPVVMRGYGDADGCSQRGWDSEKTDLSAQRKESASYGRVIISSADNLNSNLRKTPHEFSVETTDGKLTRKTSRDLQDSVTRDQDPAKELEASDETPIEREIRLSQEREANLWKERGIQRMNRRDELVEICSKPLFASSVSSPVSSRKGKDTPRVSFNIQREIEQETKREEDLQKEGRLLGAYDKGNLQELGERRKVFEQEEAVPSSPWKPKKLRGPQEPLHGEAVPDPSCSDGESLANQTVNQSFEVYQPSSAPDVGRRGPGNEFSFSSQSSTTSSKQMDSSVKPRRPRPQEVQEPAEKVVLRKEHFALPIWKPKFSFSDDQGDPHNAPKKERRPEWAAPREELYTLKTWKPRTSVLIDQEIQDALQREEELQEQRRQMRLSRTSDTNGPADKAPFSSLSSQSSVLSGVAGSYSVSSSPIFSPGSPVRLSASSSPDTACSRRNFSESDMKMPQSSIQLSMEEKKRRQREGKYAGIEPGDEIDTEVVNATRAICQRGLRAQLWEAGQISRIGDDSND